MSLHLRTEKIAAVLRRMHERRVKFMDTSVDKIALGITEDEIALGSHLIHFWQSDAEFEHGVRFLEIGIDDDSQYCVLFGHGEANGRAVDLWQSHCNNSLT